MLSSRPVSLNFDGGHPIATKTPGRALLKGRKENAVHPGARTVNVKSYKASMQTPMINKSVPEQTIPRPQTQLVKGKATAVTTTVNRPLLDKTPFPNRHRRIEDAFTPAPAKLGAPALDGDLLSVPLDGALRPSSTRKSIRGRRSSGPHFETPVTNGNHWDVSEGEIEVAGVEAVKEEEAEVEDFDEIEYMPPTAIEPPYEPPFEMPDYKVAGKLLFELMHSHQYDDRNDLYWAAEREVVDPGLLNATGFAPSTSEWERLPLAELETDDPFAAGMPPASTAASSSKHSVGSLSKRSHPIAAPARTTAKPTTSVRPTTRPPLTRAATTTALPTKNRSASVTSMSKLAPTTAKPKASAPVPLRSARPTSRPPTAGSAAAATTKRPATSTAMRPPEVPVASRPRAATTATRRPPSTSVSRPGSTRPPTSTGSRFSKAKPASLAARDKDADDLILTFDGKGGDVDFKFDV
ncbi:hypothetical protein EVG20_g7830 [Dentipellis fragilis]|uniref:Uncharacterized protein n=1 Tax=Dentipellis fragilis TaxID=205917 RepID=A0A4Y9YEM7_9AGAM|nr:hypothetical protein EVG20_g7830 [Dentipellis fragilis]